MPFPAQEQFHSSQAKWRLYAGSVRAGKTVAGSRESIRTAVEYPGSNGIIGRFSYRPLIDFTWVTFRRELEATGLIDAKMVTITGGKSPTSPPEVHFWNGSKISFRNAKREENFLGGDLDWVYLDEGSEIADNIYEQLGGARLSGTPHPNGAIVNTSGTRVAGPLRIWITTNPGPSKFLRTNFRPPGVIGTPKAGFETIPAKTDENPHLPPDYLVNLKAQFSGARYQAFVNGNWGAFEGQIFIEWDEDLHVIDNLDGESLRGRTIVEGWDFGRAVDTAVCWIAVDDNDDEPIIVVADYAAAERTPGDHAKAVRAIRERFGFKELVVVGDPSGVNRGPSGSYMEEYARHGIFIAPMQKAKSPAVRDTRLASYLNQRLTTRDGEVPGLVVCRRCQRTIDGIVGARYKPSGSNPDAERPDQRVKKDDHSLDALEYALFAAPPAMERTRERWDNWVMDGTIRPGAGDLMRYG